MAFIIDTNLPTMRFDFRTSNAAVRHVTGRSCNYFNLNDQKKLQQVQNVLQPAAR